MLQYVADDTRLNTSLSISPIPYISLRRWNSQAICELARSLYCPTQWGLCLYGSPQFCTFDWSIM